MNKVELFKWDYQKDTGVALLVSVVSITVNYLIWHNASVISIIFYFLIIALSLCIVFPTWYTLKRTGSLSKMGITTKNWEQSLQIGSMLLVFTVIGRLFQPVQQWIGETEASRWLLPRTELHPPLDATLHTLAMVVFLALYEEIFFRGYVQINVEKAFGLVPAIILSGTLYSLFNIGFSGVTSMLITLFFVGMLFAVAFVLTKNIIVPIVLNFSNGFITFFQAGKFSDARTATLSILGTAIVSLYIYVLFKKGYPKN